MRQTNLKICQVNGRSLRAATRLLDLELMCDGHDIDVLCVSETSLSESDVKMNSPLLNLPGFQPPVRCDRANGRGGGVAVYVRSGLPASSVAFQQSA